jgi:Predicted membrane protein
MTNITPISLVILIYVIINLVSFFAYGLDKSKAKKNKHRISEKTLLLLAAVGPFGAVAGMRNFRHKTKKSKFKLVYVALTVHILLLLALVVYLT